MLMLPTCYLGLSVLRKASIVICCLLIPMSAQAHQSKSKMNILVIYPDSESRPGIVLFDRTLRRSLQSISKDLGIYNEFLDSRFPDDAYQKELAEFLKRKYAKVKIDLVIVALVPSLDFVLKHRATFCPGVPVVHAAIDQRELNSRQLDKNIYGVPTQFDQGPTLDLALQLQPKTRHVVVIAGVSPMDQYWTEQARLTFTKYTNKLEFQYLTGLTQSELIDEVKTLPPDTIILFLQMFRDRHGTAYASADMAEVLASHATAPVYGYVSTYFGRGIVGGCLMNFETESENAAQLALKVLRQQEPINFSPTEARRNKLVVDGRQLQRWGIQDEHLSDNIEVRYLDPSFWDLYHWHILGVVCLCIAQSLLIAGLLLQNASRRKAESRFRLSVESAPNGMVMVSREGKIILANIQMEKLFGYQLSELIGASIEMLVPQQVRDRHDLLRTQYFASPISRPMGAGRNLFGRRKDGSEFPVEIGLNPVLNEAQPFVLATIIDITERKRDELNLKNNQQELIALTGRLMQAQETESRRIARELHDDLNQDLALLAVELDMLSNASPSSAEQLTSLSSRVKQISSTVHDLSHQLHPAKIEQLGLVAALRALCRNLSINHDLVIDFIEQDVVSTISIQIGLCLYRIAQEGLRNAIKHSEAAEVAVHLREDSRGLTMTITDDGKGFSPEQRDEKAGLGLLSMRERLRLVNGTICVDSQPGKGTIIEVHVPIVLESSLADSGANHTPAGV